MECRLEIYLEIFESCNSSSLVFTKRKLLRYSQLHWVEYNLRKKIYPIGVIDLWLFYKSASRPREVAAFLLYKNIVIKKIVHRVANWRFIIGEIAVSPKKIFWKNKCDTYHFLGNFMLNSDLKTIFKNIKIYKKNP